GGHRAHHPRPVLRPEARRSAAGGGGDRADRAPEEAGDPGRDQGPARLRREPAGAARAALGGAAHAGSVEGRRGAGSALREALVALHPYEVPEVLALPVVDGHQPYLDWLDDNVNGD